MKQIIAVLSEFWAYIKHWLWERPVSKPEREKPIRVKALEVIDEYMVIQYHKQRINIRNTELPLWNRLSRSDKRAMAKRFEIMEKKGQVRFEEINNRLIAIKNKNYEGSKNSD